VTSAPSGATPAKSPEGPRWRRPQPWWLTFVVVLAANWALMRAFAPEPTYVDIPYTLFKQQVQAGNVEELTSQGDAIQGTFKKEVTYPSDGQNKRSALRFKTRANTPYGSQSSMIERPVALGNGLFGLVRGGREGSVTITPLDTALVPETVPVQWGEFQAPRWKSLAGRFELVYTDPDGRRVTRRVTKDAASYLALIDAPPGAVAATSASLTWTRRGTWVALATQADAHQFQIIFYNEHPQVFGLTGSVRQLVFGTEPNKKVSVLCRIDTEDELAYYRHGGILQYVLRKMLES
jgi:hypothetical protein